MKWLGLLKGRCTTINDEQAQVLSGLRGLKFLDLDGCRLTDQGVQSLASLTALTTLNLTRCSYSRCEPLYPNSVQGLSDWTNFTHY